MNSRMKVACNSAAGQRCARIALAIFLLAVACPVCALGYAAPKIGIVSPPVGAAADGPSDNTAFSQDNRDVRLVAYDSAADNLVPGDVNQHRDVFVVAKSRGDNRVGGSLSLVSLSSRGREGNGDSTHPSVDGTTRAPAHCVAFQSTATNLARGDRSPDSDIYVRDLKRDTTELASPRLQDAVGATIDGHCRFAVFEARGAIYDRDLQAGRTIRVATGNRPDLQTDGKGVVYQRGGQIWYQQLRFGARGLSRQGAPRLVSTSASGGPASGISENPSVDDHGEFVVFDSTATDLCTLKRCGWDYHPGPNWRSLDPGAVPGGEDANGPVSDVYRADLYVTPADALSMLLVSYDYSYNQLPGPSVDPQISRAGQQIVFTSGPADGPRPGPASASQNVWTWSDAGHPAAPSHGHLHDWDGVFVCGPFGCPFTSFNGPSTNPSMSSRGNYIAFTSYETGMAGEANGAGIGDVFLQFITGAPFNGT